MRTVIALFSLSLMGMLFGMPRVLYSHECPHDELTTSHQYEECMEASLAIWKESIWHRIADRDGNIFGRRIGVLQRFNTEQDDEYRLDEYGNGFSITQDALWHRQRNGLRYWIGSIDNPHLYTFFDIKKEIMLTDDFSLKLRYIDEKSLETARNLLIFTFKREGLSGGRAYTFFSIHPKSYKASIDAELGFGYRLKDHAYFQMSIAALDLFNDVVLGLEKSEGVKREEWVDYSQHPYFLQVEGEFPVADKIYLELYGGTGNRYRLNARYRDDSAMNYSSHGYAHYGGLQLEWRVNNSITAGIQTTMECAVEELRYSDPSMGGDDMHLDEKTVRAIFYLMVRPHSRLTVENRIARINRPEEQTHPEGSTVRPDISHHDRELMISSEWTYRVSTRNDIIAAYLYDSRKTNKVITDLNVDKVNNRLKLRGRHRFTPGTSITLGFNIDLDSGAKLFDGGSLALLSQW